MSLSRTLRYLNANQSTKSLEQSLDLINAAHQILESAENNFEETIIAYGESSVDEIEAFNFLKAAWPSLLDTVGIATLLNKLIDADPEQVFRIAEARKAELAALPILTNPKDDDLGDLDDHPF